MAFSDGRREAVNIEGCPEKQTDALAHVVIEAHEDRVDRADVHELTCVVKELA